MGRSRKPCASQAARAAQDALWQLLLPEKVFPGIASSASAAKFRTRPRGICFTKRKTGSQVIANQAPSKGGRQPVTNPRCPRPQEQEENGAAGFNELAVNDADSASGREQEACDQNNEKKYKKRSD